jgi:hypothetical protein
MVIFNSDVKLPEGSNKGGNHETSSILMHFVDHGERKRERCSSHEKLHLVRGFPIATFD